MAYNGFSPAAEFSRFQQEHGEDTYITINLLYIAFEIFELYDPDTDEGEFDELCEIILEMALDDSFENYTIIDVADGALFIIRDSNYTVREYVQTYRRRKDKVVEELQALLEKGFSDDE